MKPFSLEEYLANPSRKVVTRDGRKARIVATDIKCKNFPIVAAVTYGDGQEVCLSYTSSGKYSPGRTKDYNDLFFAPEEHEKWINIYRDTTGVSSGAALYDSREEAEGVGKSYEHCVATARVEWEE